MLRHYEQRAQAVMRRQPANKYPVVNDYVLLDEIGRGSFGEVRLALHLETIRPVAVKIIHKKKARELASSFSVRKEIKIMQELQHPNVVKLIDVVSTHSKVLIMMDLVTGGELFDEVEHFGQLSEPYARFYFQQLVRGLDFCHSKGVYHRDLKPDNLLLDRNKTLKIADFGLGTFFGNNGNNNTNYDTAMLHTPVGTPNYIAPELIALSPEGYSGAKADAWSCGVILFVMCSGSMPFEDKNVYRLFHQIKKCHVEYPPHFSDDLKDLLVNIFQANPTTRFSLRQMSRHRWFSGPVATSEVGDDRRERPDTLEQVSEQIQEVLREYNTYKEAAASRKSGVNIPVVLNRPPQPPPTNHNNNQDGTQTSGALPPQGNNRNARNAAYDSLALGWINNTTDASMIFPSASNAHLGSNANVLNASTLDVIDSEGVLDAEEEDTTGDSANLPPISPVPITGASSEISSGTATRSNGMSQVSEMNDSALDALVTDNDMDAADDSNENGHNTSNGNSTSIGNGDMSERWPRTISNGKFSAYHSFGFESPADSDLSQLQLHQAFMRRARSLSDLGGADNNSQMNVYSDHDENIRLEVGDCAKVVQLRHSLWNRFGARLKAAENSGSSSYNIASLSKSKSRYKHRRGNGNGYRNNSNNFIYQQHHQQLVRSKSHVGRLQSRVRKELRSHRSEEAGFYQAFKSNEKYSNGKGENSGDSKMDGKQNRKVSFKVPEFLEKQLVPNPSKRTLSDGGTSDNGNNNKKKGEDEDDDEDEEGSSSEQYGDHISKMWEGKSNVAWCRLMRDIGMIPDEEEFGVDSETLESRWFAALDPDGTRRKKRSRKGKHTMKKFRGRSSVSMADLRTQVDDDSDLNGYSNANGTNDDGEVDDTHGTSNPMFHHSVPSIVKGDMMTEANIPREWIEKFVTKTGFNSHEHTAISRALYQKKVPKNEVQPVDHYTHIMKTAKGKEYVSKLILRTGKNKFLPHTQRLKCEDTDMSSSSPANTLLGNGTVLKPIKTDGSNARKTIKPALIPPHPPPGNHNNNNNSTESPLQTSQTVTRRYRVNQKLKTVAIGPLHADYRREKKANKSNDTENTGKEGSGSGKGEDSGGGRYGWYNNNNGNGNMEEGEEGAIYDAADKRDFMKKLKITDMDIPGPENDLTIPAPLPLERYLRKPIQYMKRIISRVQVIPAFHYRVKYSFHIELECVVEMVRQLFRDEGGRITESGDDGVYFFSSSSSSKRKSNGINNNNSNSNSNSRRMLVLIPDANSSNSNSSGGELHIVVRFIEDRCTRLLLRRSKGSRTKYAVFVSELEAKLESKLEADYFSKQQQQIQIQEGEEIQQIQEEGIQESDGGGDDDDKVKADNNTGVQQEKLTAAQLVPG